MSVLHFFEGVNCLFVLAPSSVFTSPSVDVPVDFLCAEFSYVLQLMNNSLHKYPTSLIVLPLGLLYYVIAS